MHFVYFFGILFLVLSCSSNPIEEDMLSHIPPTSKKTKNNLSFYEDLKYGPHEQQSFDLYEPLNNPTIASKVIITIHGGGWVNGDKASMTAFVTKIQELNPNHTIVNMNYRLANANQFAFPDQFDDIKKIINYLTKNSVNLNILPEFGFIGKSAGGHLALQYDSIYDTLDQVKFICSLAGPTNFSIPFFMDDPEFNYLFDLLIDQDHYEFDHKVLKLLSPAYQSSTNNSPTLLFHGIYDNVVPLENSLELRYILNNDGVPVTLYELEEGHASWSENSMELVYTTIEKFIDQYL